MTRYYASLMSFMFVWLIAILIFEGYESTEGIAFATLAGLVAAGLAYAYMSTKK